MDDLRVSGEYRSRLGLPDRCAYERMIDVGNSLAGLHLSRSLTVCALIRHSRPTYSSRQTWLLDWEFRELGFTMPHGLVASLRSA
jgi:hypothetical protein